MEPSSNLHKLTPALVRIGLALLLLIIAAAILLLHLSRSPSQAEFDIDIIPPTCTESGYSLYKNRTTGDTQVRDIVQAAGHDFGAWETVRQSDGITCTLLTRTCHTCAFEEQQIQYPDLSIPRLCLAGNLTGISKTNEVDMTAQFSNPSSNTQFSCYATLKYQGHESLGYEKKNYTLKFFEDSLHDKKLKLQLEHWNSENKYILKANYIDMTSCRNLICADVWADICKERSSLPAELETASNYGAVDGYPVAVYINDQFEGLYTMNLHKDEDLYCMEDGEKQAVLISNHAATPEAYFRAQATFTDSSPWEVEYCGTEDQTWAQEQLNELINFVLTADDEKFRTELNRYLDVDSAVDYLIAMYALGLTNNGSQNLILISYDTPWIASMYDMENAFGLYSDGTGAYSAQEYLPAQTVTGWNSATGSLLWDRLLENFSPEICARYRQLRSEILDPNILCNRVEQFISGIPAELYQAEEARWPRQAFISNDQSQITNYIVERIAALDQIFM